MPTHDLFYLIFCVPCPNYPVVCVLMPGSGVCVCQYEDEQKKAERMRIAALARQNEALRRQQEDLKLQLIKTSVGLDMSYSST